MYDASLTRTDKSNYRINGVTNTTNTDTSKRFVGYHYALSGMLHYEYRADRL